MAEATDSAFGWQLEQFHQRANQPRPPGAIPAIRINSLGERRMLGSDLFELEWVTPEAADEYQWPSPLAFQIGLPWVVRLVRDHQAIYHSEQTFHPDVLHNEDATLIAAVYTGGMATSSFLPPARTLDGMQYTTLTGTVRVIHSTVPFIPPHWPHELQQD